jgi:hypothetical protein
MRAGGSAGSAMEVQRPTAQQHGAAAARPNGTCLINPRATAFLACMPWLEAQEALPLSNRSVHHLWRVWCRCSVQGEGLRSTLCAAVYPTYSPVATSTQCSGPWCPAQPAATRVPAGQSSRRQGGPACSPGSTAQCDVLIDPHKQLSGPLKADRAHTESDQSLCVWQYL